MAALGGLHQLRIAETEKYAHVTYFFNGGREVDFPNEDRALIPSPKVATYDLQPEMSAQGITDELLRRLSGAALPYDLVVLNPVHLLLVDDGLPDVQVRDGIFADVAPTILGLLGLAVPAEMTGHDLLKG